MSSNQVAPPCLVQVTAPNIVSKPRTSLLLSLASFLITTAGLLYSHLLIYNNFTLCRHPLIIRSTASLILAFGVMLAKQHLCKTTAYLFHSNLFDEADLNQVIEW